MNMCITMNNNNETDEKCKVIENTIQSNNDILRQRTIQRKPSR